MKLALGQIRVISGDPVKNYETMRQYINKAVDYGCSLIAFPEMCVGGYLLGDRWTDETWCDYLMAFNEKIKDLSENIAVIYGNVFVDNGSKNKDGRRRKFNAAYAFYNRKPVKHAAGILPDGIAIKCLLPNYRIFDDERYFFSLQELAADEGLPIQELLQPFIATIGGKQISFGVEICEDLWFNDYYYNKKPLNVSKYLIENGAELIVNLSSSPWTYGKNNARNNRIRDSFNDCRNFVPFYYVNCVGCQNNGKNIIVFDGDSTVYNKNAEVIKAADDPFEEELIVVDTSQVLRPYIKENLPGICAKYKAILEGIRGMDQIIGNSIFTYVIGVSGGIDSALVLCLLHKAVGNKRIIAVNMPTKYNSEKTKNIAKKLAEKLEIPYFVLPIEELVNCNTAILSQFNPDELNCENIQAKLRGTSILSNIAGIVNGLMVCNGNKVEVALGYATLYGDVNGGVAPIADLLKTEVFEMASFINDKIYKEETIPYSLIPNALYEFEMPPSAELKHNQIDPMKWGYHDALVRAFTDYKKYNPADILQWYKDGVLCEQLGISKELFIKYQLYTPQTFISDLEWVVKNMQKAVFKRIQSPPIIILSKGAFGCDIRESQLPFNLTDRYRQLKNEILSATEK
jgi:NAD+ synthase (glutamine-hydrolysing)